MRGAHLASLRLKTCYAVYAFGEFFYVLAIPQNAKRQSFDVECIVDVV